MNHPLCTRGFAAWLKPAVVPMAALCLTLVMVSQPLADESNLPTYLRDRGEGIPTSLFGTYVQNKELLLYLFYEYTVNSDKEYKPSELGFVGSQDYRAKRTETEGLAFLSYGFSENWAVELESALYGKVTQHKATNDPSAMPQELSESGLGDTQAELRWRWSKETARRPELFSYFETVFPLQKDKVLLGTQDWEFILGLGLIKGGSWGTLLGRASAVQVPDANIEVDELSLEYLKRFSPSLRGDLAVEGAQDEWALIAEAQWFLKPNLFVKLNNGFGLTDKAPDLAPEVGVVFTFR